MYKAQRDFPLNGVAYKQGDPVPFDAAPERIMKNLVGRGWLKADVVSMESAGQTEDEIMVDIPNLEEGTKKVKVTGKTVQSILNELAMQGFLTVQNGLLAISALSSAEIETHVDQLQIPIMVQIPNGQSQEFLLTTEKIQQVFTLLQTSVRNLEEQILPITDNLDVLAVADAVDSRKSAKELYAARAQKIINGQKEKDPAPVSTTPSDKPPDNPGF